MALLEPLGCPLDVPSPLLYLMLLHSWTMTCSACISCRCICLWVTLTLQSLSLKITMEDKNDYQHMFRIFEKNFHLKKLPDTKFYSELVIGNFGIIRVSGNSHTLPHTTLSSPSSGALDSFVWCMGVWWCGCGCHVLWLCVFCVFCCGCVVVWSCGGVVVWLCAWCATLKKKRGQPLVCRFQHASVSRFKTSPCVPATSPHVLHIRRRVGIYTQGGHRQFSLPKITHVEVHQRN